MPTDRQPVPVQLPHAATLAGYDRWAASYDATANPMVAATAWALRTRPFDVAGEDVVEFGCGTGRHAGAMLAAGARSFTGLDGSAGMLAIARTALAEPRVHWVQGELAPTPFAAGTFDRALVVLVLEHVPALTAVAMELARVLRPGGALRVLEIHPDLVAAGTGAHFHDGGAEVRFTSVPHTHAALLGALMDARFTLARIGEPAAAGDLLYAVPRLAKHAGRRVLLDVLAHRA
jgi:malonyl-CoA O-methyltransferase